MALRTHQLALLIVLAAWLARPTLADHPAPAPKDADTVKAAAQAHARANAQRLEAALRARAQVAAHEAAKFEKVRQAALQAQVEREQGAADLHAKTYLEPFRQRLELETHHVERACELNDEQSAALRKQAAEIAEHAQAELAKALAGQAGQPRQAVAIVNGNAVAVPSGVSGEYLTDPAQAARSELLRVMADTLPEAAKAKLDEADRQRHERALAATRLAALAVLDDALLLSAPQRDEIGRLLDAAWAVPVALGRNPILAGAPHAVEMLYSARLVLPKAKLAAVLRPAQQAAFKSLSEPAVQAPAAGPRVVRMNQPAAAVPLNRFDGAVKQANAARIKVNPGGMMGGGMMGGGMMGGGRPLLGVLQPLNGAVRPANYLDLVVDDVAAACELSDELRTKLLLAGRLDLKRVAKPPDDAVKGVGVNNPAGMMGQMRVVGQGNNLAGGFGQLQARRDAEATTALTGPSSAYQKVLTGKLSEEQLQRLTAAKHERLVLHQRAAVAAALQAIDERVLLSAQQHRRLSEFLEDQVANARNMNPTAGPGGEALAGLARVSPRQLEPMLDEFQRPLAASLWQELCATVFAARQPLLQFDVRAAP